MIRTSLALLLTAVLAATAGATDPQGSCAPIVSVPTIAHIPSGCGTPCPSNTTSCGSCSSCAKAAAPATCSSCQKGASRSLWAFFCYQPLQKGINCRECCYAQSPSLYTFFPRCPEGAIQPPDSVTTCSTCGPKAAHPALPALSLPSFGSLFHGGSSSCGSCTTGCSTATVTPVCH